VSHAPRHQRGAQDQQHDAGELGRAAMIRTTNARALMHQGMTAPTRRAGIT